MLIGEEAFHSLIQLREVTLLGSSTTIGDDAFHGCESLSSLTMSQNETVNASLTDPPYIGKLAFSRCHALTTVDLGNGFSDIRESAFAECESLESIHLPRSVRYIGDFAFDELSCLSTVDLSEGLLSIGHSAFHGCSDLIRINIPSTVRIIERQSFAECEKLSQVILSEGLESIQGEAFYGCTSLETIGIPSTVCSAKSFVSAHNYLLSNFCLLTKAHNLFYYQIFVCHTERDDEDHPDSHSTTTKNNWKKEELTDTSWSRTKPDISLILTL
jgi:hypothetical protein